MIRVDKHSRGLALSTTLGIDRDKRTRRLEEQLSVYQVIVSRGRLIAPLEASGDLLHILGLEGVCWDEQVLSEAQVRLASRDMQMLARLEVARALEDPYKILCGYRRLHHLDVHQVEAVAAIVAPSLRGIAIFDEQGTGKTIMALASFEWLREQAVVQRLLVIAPKSVQAAWQIQCSAFLESSFRVVVVHGSPAERRRAILSQHDILIVGYEAAVACEGILHTIISARPSSYMLVVDESYFVKNPATIRARVVAKLRASCERAIVLCGTPAPNSAIDVINQIDIADNGTTFSGRTIPKDADEAYNLVAEALQDAIYLRRLKEDVLPGIPSKQVEKVYLELTERQRKLYRQIRDELVLEVRSLDERQFKMRLGSFLVKRLRLLQVCSNPGMIDHRYDELPAKILVLDQLVKELVKEQGKKVVVWSYFRASIDLIANRYAHCGVVRIDGAIIRMEERLRAIDRFQNDSTTRIFVGNAAAAGAGITLTAAHHAIYESFSNQAGHYLQSVDRIHRRGQTQQVTSHILIARDTIEEHEYSRLLNKERAGRELLGDCFEEPLTRERFLAELGAM